MDQNYDFQSNNFTPDSPFSPQPDNRAKNYAKVSLILGIIAVFFSCLCCCFYYLALPLGAVAIVMAILSKKKNGGKLSGMALAGLILGIVGLILFLMMVCFEVYLVSAFSSMTEAEWLAFLEEYGFSAEDFGELFPETTTALPN